MNALAFTKGNDIHFAPDLYNPTSQHGQTIIGHELAHVLQQQNGQSTNQTSAVGETYQQTSLESEAESWLSRQ